MNLMYLVVFKIKVAKLSGLKVARAVRRKFKGSFGKKSPKQISALCKSIVKKYVLTMVICDNPLMLSLTGPGPSMKLVDTSFHLTQTALKLDKPR